MDIVDNEIVVRVDGENISFSIDDLIMIRKAM
jgi:hypothetical protein